MHKLELIGFEKKEIKNISGKVFSFKKIKIPNDEDCTNFLIRYEIINTIDKSTFSSPILCLPSVYQRDVSQVILYNSISIPENSIFNIQIESTVRPDFSGKVSIDYDILDPTEASNKEELMVFITENDRENAFRSALINLARFFKIPNWEYDDNQTIYNKIKKVNSPIVKLLQNYIGAYNDWFNFYTKIKETENTSGLRYELNDNEKTEIARLIGNRVNSLNALQVKFDELQFEEFKKSKGLDNVDGIML